MPKFSVIFPASGQSARFGANKLIADLANQPVIVRAINAFLPREDVFEIIIATNNRTAIERTITALAHAEIILKSPKLRWCKGGETRAQTVRIAAETTRCEWIAIHDAARPLVTDALIDRVFDAAVRTGAAAPAMPVSLTIKEATGPLPATVVKTVPRERLWAMQTPQAMRREDFLHACKSCSKLPDQITDDLQLLELAGMAVTLVDGEESNLKITTPLDLQIASILLAQRSVADELA